MKKSDFAVALMAAGLTTSAYAQAMDGGGASWIKSLFTTWIPIVLILAAVLGFVWAAIDLLHRGRTEGMFKWLGGCAIMIGAAVVMRPVVAGITALMSLITSM